MMDLSIIIVTYNSEKIILPCLGSIYKETQKYQFEVIIVDNASHDTTKQIIKDNYKDVKIIESKENLGFSKANNLGAKEGKGKYLMFLNPDTIIEDAAIDKLITFYRNHLSKEIGIVGPVLFNRDGTIQPSAREFPNLKNMLSQALFLNKLFPGIKCWGNYMMTYFNFKSSREVEWLTGACLLTQKDIFFSIGGFEERFFLFSEDVDLCWRYKKSGYKCLFFSEAHIIHLEGASCNLKSISRGVIEQESKNLLWNLHYPPSYVNALKAVNLVNSMLRMGLWGIAGLLIRTKRKRGMNEVKYYWKVIQTTYNGRE